MIALKAEVWNNRKDTPCSFAWIITNNPVQTFLIDCTYIFKGYIK